MVVFEAPKDMLDWVGRELGASPWFTVDQATIDAFADATGDHQWIHVDTARAAREMPGSRTIAHGFLVLALFARLIGEVYKVNGARQTINYGIDRLRFTAPVPVGGRVRLRLSVASAEATPGGIRVTHDATMELEDSPRPAFVARQIRLLVP
ncbi:MAG: MaoC family dehydratase [Alphaproteobacteria bacterium]|nr:MaoC family dehydratase [Alphaproteobacteria bacterium]